MSTLMQFELAPHTLLFENGGDYPATRMNEFLQVQDRTAGGTLQIENLGVQIKKRVINFNLMTKTDYDNLVDWFINKTNGVEKTFIFTDEYGVAGNVKFADTVLDFAETSLNRYSGQITLEYV